MDFVRDLEGSTCIYSFQNSNYGWCVVELVKKDHVPVHGACHAIVDVVSLLTSTLYIIYTCQCAHTVLITVYVHVHVLPSRSLSTCICGGAWWSPY